MKRIFATIPLVILVLLVVVTAAQSQDQAPVTGVWKGDWSVQKGPHSGTVLLDLRQKETKVTGTISFQLVTSYGHYSYNFQERIKNGEIKGQVLTFEVPGGLQIMSGRFVVRGRSMRGTLENIPPDRLTDKPFPGQASLQRK